MTTTTIPARTVKTCDRCGTEMVGANCTMNGKVSINQSATDFNGVAVADASRSFDLCDTCLPKITTAINSAMAPSPTAGIFGP